MSSKNGAWHCLSQLALTKNIAGSAMHLKTQQDICQSLLL
jgi:hypothetical protein